MKKLKKTKSNINLSNKDFENPSLEKYAESIIEDINRDISLSVLAHNLQVLGGYIMEKAEKGKK